MRWTVVRVLSNIGVRQLRMCLLVAATAAASVLIIHSKVTGQPQTVGSRIMSPAEGEHKGWAQVIIILGPNFAYKNRASSVIVDRLAEIEKEFNTTIQSMHPGVKDPILAKYLFAEVPDPSRAQELAARLRAEPEIETAYAKPPGEVPR